MQEPQAVNAYTKTVINIAMGRVFIAKTMTSPIDYPIQSVLSLAVTTTLTADTVVTVPFTIIRRLRKKHQALNAVISVPATMPIVLEASIAIVIHA